MLTPEDFQEFLQIEREKGAGETDAVYCTAPFEPPQATKNGASIPQRAFHIGTVGDMPLRLYAEWMRKSREFQRAKGGGR